MYRLIQRYWTNNQIRAKELRVIDNEDTNLGVLSLSEALKLAEEKGLDLVLTVPNANPPVGKITSFDKFRYQEAKKEKQQKAAKKNTGSKRIQISIRSAEDDLRIKANRGNKFLAEGHQLEIMMTLRGREKGKKDFARKKLLEFVEAKINPDHQVVSTPRPGGRGITMLISPKPGLQ